MLKARGNGAWFAGSHSSPRKKTTAEEEEFRRGRSPAKGGEGGAPLALRSPAVGGPVEEGGVGRSPEGWGGAPQASGSESLCPRIHRQQVLGLCTPPASGLTWTVSLWPSQAAPLCQTLSFQTGEAPFSRTQCSHGQGQKQGQDKPR